LSDQIEAAVEAAPSAPVANEAWFLHSAGRVFGPLDEDQMRGYFRAGMVKANDTIAVASMVGTVSALEAAALLGVAPPTQVGTAAAPAPTSIVVRQVGEKSSSGALVAVFALVVLIGGAYFYFHKPLQLPDAQSTAPAEPVGKSAPEAEALVPEAANTPPVAPRPTPSFEMEVSTPVSTREPTIAPARAEAAPPAQGTNAPVQASDEWWDAADRFYASQDWAGLAGHTEKWTQAQPQRDVAWWYLGVARYQLADYAASIAAAQRALAISPGFHKARWLLSDSYLKAKQWRKSLDELNVLLKVFPEDARLWNDIGIDQANLGEYDDSIAAFEKAVQIDPAYKRAWVNLAQNYAYFGNMDRANAAMAKAKSL